MSRDWSFGDGLSPGLHESLMEVLGPALRDARRQRRASCACAGSKHERRWNWTSIPHIVAIARGVVAERSPSA